VLARFVKASARRAEEAATSTDDAPTLTDEFEGDVIVEVEEEVIVPRGV
jgi:hypothetical protein